MSANNIFSDALIDRLFNEIIFGNISQLEALEIFMSAIPSFYCAPIPQHDNILTKLIKIPSKKLDSVFDNITKQRNTRSVSSSYIVPGIPLYIYIDSNSSISAIDFEVDRILNITKWTYAFNLPTGDPIVLKTNSSNFIFDLPSSDNIHGYLYSFVIDGDVYIDPMIKIYLT
jgi:hypothetical protein